MDVVIGQGFMLMSHTLNHGSLKTCLICTHALHMSKLEKMVITKIDSIFHYSYFIAEYNPKVTVNALKTKEIKRFPTIDYYFII